jgi:hypothetical protein
MSLLPSNQDETRDKYLRPLNAPITKIRGTIAYEYDTQSDRGMVKSYQLAGGMVNEDQIGPNAVTTPKIDSQAVTTGKIANGAVTDIKIAGFDWGKGTSGTIGTATMIGGTIGTALIGTCNIVAGNIGTPLFTGGTIQTVTIGTSIFAGGTVQYTLLGTSQITGGTIQAAVYKGNAGSVGLSTTISYLNVSTTPGTLIFSKGLLVSVT